MLKKRPVVGATVMPPWETAATRTRPLVAFTEFCSTNTGLGRTVPVRLVLTGRSTDGSTSTCTSKPFKADELKMLTATWSCPPTVPRKFTGRDGHVVVETSAMHTTPVWGGGAVTIVNEATVECNRLPLVPVTFTPKVPVEPPAVVVNVSVDDACPPDDNVTLVGLMLQPGQPGQVS